jgi:uncharacterized membrane protein HdeD (DUF308 family)
MATAASGKTPTSAADERCEVMSELLAENWWVVGLRGLFGIISGIKAARSGERWGLLLLEGVVDIAAGAVAFLWPAITAVAFVLIIAVWAIISGGLMLGAAFSLKLEHGRWWLALGGVASVIFGIVLLIAPVVAFQLHSRREEHKRKAPAPAAAAKKA